jgi:uncharacterized protein YcnI
VRRAVAAAAALALALPAAALAHVTVVPSFLDAGERTTLALDTPNERPPHAMVGLTLRVPDGIDLSPVSAPPGWTLDLARRTAVWSGGKVGPGGDERFRIAATTRLAPTAVRLTAVQRYDDGATVRWTVPLTVLPASKAPKEHLWPAFLAGALGLVVIVGGLAFLRLRSRDGDDAAA